MSALEDHRAQARATWSAGDWDGEFWKLVTPVGALALERAGIADGVRLLDVGTGSGGNVAIPAALMGASVTGLDPTPELLVHARRRAAEAGVEADWVEGDAQALPFDDHSFDRVISTFGAMFAPDHARAAAELVRVCASGGRIVMTTWLDEGFAGGLFDLTASFLPSPPPGVQPNSLWGNEGHATEMFAGAGVTPAFERASVDFCFASVGDMVQHYAEGFGPFVAARRVLEPAGSWADFLDAYSELVARFNVAGDGSARVPAEYLLISADC